MKRIISRGAEAILSYDNKIVTKDRIKKSYRHHVLDERLRKLRTRHEARILEMLAATGFPCPKVLHVDEAAATLQIDHVPGKLVKDVLKENEEKNEKNSAQSPRMCKEIGQKVAWLHSLNIIHHDLTTSNMILHEKKKEVFFIDFGLSFTSSKIEDRAVDLHLLLHALESQHQRISEACFAEVLAGYSEKSNQAKEVIDRLHVVERRGRYKQG